MWREVGVHLVHSTAFDSLEQSAAEQSIMSLVNNIRLHGTLGYLSPAVFKENCTFQFLSDLGLTIHAHFRNFVVRRVDKHHLLWYYMLRRRKMAV